MENEVIKLIGQYGIVGLLFYFSIKEFFNYIKGRKENGKDEKQDTHFAVIDQRLKTLEVNHIPHIQNDIKDICQKLEKNEEQHRELLIGQAKIMTKMGIE